MLQTAEIATERIQSWFRSHPSVAETDANIAILTKYIADHFSVAGECLIDALFLDLAYQSIGGTLQHLAGPEVQQQIARANQQALDAQTKLAEEQAAKAREDEKLRRELERQSRQDARRAGPSSAFENRDERAAEVAKAHQAVRDQAEKNALHQQFVAELKSANQILLTINGGGMVAWGRNNEARANARKSLVQKYPMFASEVR